MDPTAKIPIRRFEAGRAASQVDSVVTEARVRLDVNDGLLRLTMLCLGRDLDALAVGFLLGEGALRRLEDIHNIEVRTAESEVAVRGDFDADALQAIQQRWTLGTGCGFGGTARDLDSPAHAPVPAGSTISPGRLLELARQFHREGRLWKLTGGVHACALAGGKGVIMFAEDIGRHNAFDKVMGKAAMGRIDVTDKLVLTTGRLSAEIVAKAIACRVPMLVSRCAVTSLAVELARKSGMTLAGFARGKRLNVYTGYQRVASEQST